MPENVCVYVTACPEIITNHNPGHNMKLHDHAKKKFKTQNHDVKNLSSRLGEPHNLKSSFVWDMKRVSANCSIYRKWVLRIKSTSFIQKNYVI